MSDQVGLGLWTYYMDFHNKMIFNIIFKACSEEQSKKSNLDPKYQISKIEF